MSLAALLAIAALVAAGLAARLVAHASWPMLRPWLWGAGWAGFGASRLAFVLQWQSAYFSHPLQILDLRDGGFDPSAGMIVAVLVAMAAVRRRRALRRGFIAAFSAAALVGIPGMIALLAHPAPGAPLPELALDALAGPQRGLAAFTGRPTVVNLWATWCPPCRRELPALVQAQREHPELNFVFVDEGESRDEVAGYLARGGLVPSNVLLDPAQRLGAAFQQQGFPTTLFFDAGGRLVGRRMGALDAATLAQRLAALGPKGR